MIQPKLGCHIL